MESSISTIIEGTQGTGRSSEGEPWVDSLDRSLTRLGGVDQGVGGAERKQLTDCDIPANAVIKSNKNKNEAKKEEK